MNQKNLIGAVRQILSTIYGMTVRVKEKTIEMNELLSLYDIESMTADRLNLLISQRESFYTGIIAQQQQLDGFTPDLAAIEVNDEMTGIENLKNQILADLEIIIEHDKKNKDQIAHFRDLASQKASKVQHGKKVVQAYNVFPHQKSIFIDLAVKK